MSLKNHEIQASIENKENYGYQSSLRNTYELNKKIKANGYNPDKYGVDPKIGTFYDRTGKIKIIINEQAQPIDTGYTLNDYTTNRYGSFTIFTITKRINDLAEQHKSDIESIGWKEKQEIKKETISELYSFLSEQVYKGIIIFTGLKNKTEQKINDMLGEENQQVPEQNSDKIKDKPVPKSKIDNKPYNQAYYKGTIFGDRTSIYGNKDYSKYQRKGTAEETLKKYK